MSREEFIVAIYSLDVEQLTKAETELRFGWLNLDREEWVTTYVDFCRNKPDFEAQCVEILRELGCNVKTEEDKRTDAAVGSANANESSAEAAQRAADAAERSSEDSKRSADAAETANRRGWLSWGPAVLALILSFAAFYRGCVDTRRNNRSDNVPTDTSETVEGQQEGTD